MWLSAVTQVHHRSGMAEDGVLEQWVNGFEEYSES